MARSCAGLFWIEAPVKWELICGQKEFCPRFICPLSAAEQLENNV